MEDTCHEAGERRTTAHLHRGGARVGRTVTELAVVVVAPAVRGATQGEAAGVLITRHEASERLTTGHHHWGGAGPIGRAVAELAGPVPSPAVGGATGGESARVAMARCEASEGTGCACLCGRWRDIDR